jgi:hypothetical protein
MNSRMAKQQCKSKCHIEWVVLITNLVTDVASEMGSKENLAHITYNVESCKSVVETEEALC